jgi:hypothetical protein
MKGKRIPDPVRSIIIERVKNGERVDDVAGEFSINPERKHHGSNSRDSSQGRVHAQC